MNIVRILFIGDVVGEPGMRILESKMSYLKLKYAPGLIIVNGENTRNGKGLSEGLATKYFNLGVDVITSGNHIWDYANFHKTLNDSRFSRALRPYNYPEGVPGNGFCIKESSGGIDVGVINLQGRVFMQSIDCPFNAAIKAVNKINKKTKVIFVDFHAEASAEKISMGWWLDGKVSAVVGTHTHVQTADERIFPNGTAFITDAGMTGCFNSVIGMKVETALNRSRFQTPFRYESANDGNLHINAVIIDIDADTGKSISIERLDLTDETI